MSDNDALANEAALRDMLAGFADEWNAETSATEYPAQVARSFALWLALQHGFALGPAQPAPTDGSPEECLHENERVWLCSDCGTELRRIAAQPAPTDTEAHRRTFPNIAFDRDGEDGSGDAWCSCGNPWPCPDAQPEPLPPLPTVGDPTTEAARRLRAMLPGTPLGGQLATEAELIAAVEQEAERRGREQALDEAVAAVEARRGYITCDGGWHGRITLSPEGAYLDAIAVLAALAALRGPRP